MASKFVPQLLRQATRAAPRAPRRQLYQPRYFSTSPSSRHDETHPLSVHRDSPGNNPSIPFKFNETNLRLIDEITKRYPPQYKKAAVMPLLDLGQRQYGFTSISVMNEVARILEMPPMRVYEVATFYTMYNRDPVGKYFVQVCTTTPCMLGGVGSDLIMKACEDFLGIHSGDMTKDKIFSLLEVECLGACANAPMMMINDDYYEDLTAETTKQILKALKDSETITGFDKSKMPRPGPQPYEGHQRMTSEPRAGKTALLSEPYHSKDVMRADGEL